MPDLRTWWASASPRERDAKVAEALGWGSVESREDLNGAWYGIEPATADRPWPAWKELPDYSTAREHVGFLLDAFGSDTDWEMARRADRVVTVRVRRFAAGEAAAEFSARCETAPEAIALAFCLAKQDTFFGSRVIFDPLEPVRGVAPDDSAGREASFQGR